jgi:hypothetical protein
MQLVSHGILKIPMTKKNANGHNWEVIPNAHMENHTYNE